MIKQLAILFITCGISVGALAQTEQEITWENLIPAGLDFEDPFLELDDEQLYNLKFLYKTRLLIEKKPELVTEKVKAKNDSLESLLSSQGVNVDYLISKRDEIKELRAKQALSTVDSLNNKSIKMAGFLLPLDFSNKEAKEFLFVPYVGACIHMPTPPKNQIVYLTYENGYHVTEKYTAVWVNGNMQVKDNVKELYLVDGKDEIKSGYSLDAIKIQPYDLKQ